MNRLLIAGALLLGLAANTAQAKLNVFTCEPEWGSLSKRRCAVMTITSGSGLSLALGAS